MAFSNLQTQCPHCQTRFRVTEEQLKVAKGRVRCGSCRQIFNAFENRIKESKPVVTTPPEPVINPDPDDGLVFADNPEEDAAHGAYIKADMTFAEDELSDSFRSMDHSVYSDDRDNSSDINPDSDESWAHAILDEASRHESPRRPAPPGKAAPPIKAAPSVKATPSKNEPPADAPNPGTQSLTQSSDSWSLPSEHQIYAESGARSQHTPYSNLRQEPIPVQGNHSGKIRALAWLLIVLAILGVIVSQLAWVQFDKFSKIPQLRPFYEKGCELAGCTLPPLIDMSAIDSRKLVVKTNPANRSELVVDAVIINRAAFAQPFPAIILTFADLNGQEVTQRVFSPADYLADQGAQLREMPPQTPIRIAIAIQDPGQTAVSYNIDFRSQAE
ncbi:putative Zn finger-like uncharacterized protein [Marinobacter sp. LV10R520-4]|uniref:DUF3426 domain-containing protein n=1 Tax=Marinobacter sp. LV10R520-4 TaxID=1761796 RepID=UPI000BF2D8AE|nr:DUF3426 domain-containing protein [Marinobacter sp. LV10R520-4]PFG52936.1 putative Zn finger-like uncharacterized protein [Marinobacter sp. LV10R520-4]